MRKEHEGRMIKNSTKKKVLAETVMFARSLRQKCKGVMFTKKSFLENKGLVFVFPEERRVGLHMMFVNYPIDVLWLDSRRKVVEMKKQFLPWTFYSPSKRARYVIELPSGTLERTRTEAGDSISF